MGFGVALASGLQNPARCEDPRPAARIDPVAVSFDLSSVVAVDYDLTVRELDRDPRRVHVRVEFPDETRSLLESLTWTGGRRIVSVLERIGATAIEGAFDVTSAGPDRWRLAARPPEFSTIQLPIGALRAGLEPDTGVEPRRRDGRTTLRVVASAAPSR